MPVGDDHCARAGALLFTDLLESGRMGTTVEPEGVYCSDCGARNIKEAAYCKKRGKKLELANHPQLKNYQESAIGVAP